eukprot:8223632-Ditylum_brightwellii.AAC.1
MRNEWDDILVLEAVAYFYDEKQKSSIRTGGDLHSAGRMIHGGSSNAITHNAMSKMELHSAVEELLRCCTLPPSSSHSNKCRKGEDTKRKKQIAMVVP